MSRHRVPPQSVDEAIAYSFAVFPFDKPPDNTALARKRSVHTSASLFETLCLFSFRTLSFFCFHFPNATPAYAALLVSTISRCSRSFVSVTPPFPSHALAAPFSSFSFHQCSLFLYFFFFKDSCPRNHAACCVQTVIFRPGSISGCATTAFLHQKKKKRKTKNKEDLSKAESKEHPVPPACTPALSPPLRK